MPAFGGFAPGFTSSGSEDDSKPGFDWKSLIAPGLLGASTLFAPKTTDATGLINQVKTSAEQTGKQGAALFGAGQADLAPVRKYLTALGSGDSTAILNATAPQRARVVDQYDAARKAIATFSPRGGGSASAGTTLATKEASDLATTTASARTDAVDKLASLATTETSQGLTAEAQSQQAMAELIKPILEQQAHDESGIASFFTGLTKTILPFILA